MALKSGKNGRIYLLGYDISGKANRFNIALPREFEDVTCFGNSGHRWHPKLHNNSFGFDALYDAATKVHITDDGVNTVAAATATDQGTLETLLNEIKADYTAHRVGTAYHDNADTVNAVAAEDATDLPTATALANEIKTDYNTHRTQTNVHPEDDEFFNAVVSAAATDLATGITLANEEKGSYNNHLSGTVKRITEIMNTLRSSSGIASLCLGASQGDKAVAGHGVFQQDYPIEMPVEGMLKMAGDFVFSDMAKTGYILQAKLTKTADGTATSFDGGALSVDGCEAFLHVFGCGADDNLDVKVQDSTATAAGWANIATFTTATGVTSERATATGTVNRYLRVTWEGAEPYSANFAVIFSRL